MITKKIISHMCSFRFQNFENFQLLKKIQFKNNDDKSYLNFLNEIGFFDTLFKLNLKP